LQGAPAAELLAGVRLPSFTTSVKEASQCLLGRRRLLQLACSFCSRPRWSAARIYMSW